MKKCIKCLITIGAIFATTVTQAMYLGTTAGYMVDNEEEVLAVQLGFSFAQSDSFSSNLELEVGYITYSEGSEGIDVYPVLINYLLKSNLAKGLGFYIGGGGGYSFYDASVYGYSASGEILTWQGLIGITYAFNATTSLKLGYRYIYLDEINVDGYGSADLDMDDSIIEVGLVFQF